MASCQVRLSLDRAVRVQAQVGDIVYPHSTLLHPGIQMGTGEFNAGGNQHPIQVGVEILLVTSC